MKNNTNGFTLVELLVVVAISSVLLVLVGVGYSTVFSNKAKAASGTIYTMIGTAQNLGMSKENCLVRLSGNDKQEITVQIIKKNGTSETIIETNKFSKVDVSVVVSSSSTVTIDSTHSVDITINRSTGNFSGAKEIIIGSGSNVYTIALSDKTGKFFYK